MENENNKGEENLKAKRQIEESLSFIADSPVHKQRMLEQKQKEEDAKAKKK